MAERHAISFWKGSRYAYNVLVRSNTIEEWTRYTIVEPDGRLSEYIGSVPLSTPTGQIPPVDAIVDELPPVEELQAGQRYLVGRDKTDVSPAEYYVVTIGDEGGDKSTASKIEVFDENFGVRVKENLNKSYVLVNGILTTYDFTEIDCGTF